MFKNVAIVGIGLLGGSLARDLRVLGLASSITGICRSADTADTALEEGIIDEVLPLKEAAAKADILVIATPMQSMLPILQQLEGEIPSKLIVTDVGSVKTDLYTKLKVNCPRLLDQFVLAHPIAGGESSGVNASRTQLFKHKHVIITETPEVAQESIQTVRCMWQKVGANVVNMGVEAHDSVFAKTSHLPHVVAFSLINYLNSQNNKDELFALAASGFYDFTRIASSDAEMWRDICVTNKESVLEAIDGFSEHLSEIRAKIANQEQDKILEYFRSAKSARDTGLLQKEKG